MHGQILETRWSLLLLPYLAQPLEGVVYYNPSHACADRLHAMITRLSSRAASRFKNVLSSLEIRPTSCQSHTVLPGLLPGSELPGLVPIDQLIWIYLLNTHRIRLLHFFITLYYYVIGIFICERGFCECIFSPTIAEVEDLKIKICFMKP